jgi:hypothetical protein
MTKRVVTACAAHALALHPVANAPKLKVIEPPPHLAVAKEERKGQGKRRQGKLK